LPGFAWSDREVTGLMRKKPNSEYLYLHVKHKRVNNYDEFVKNQDMPFIVIPAQAGIQLIQAVIKNLDSGFHRSDDFLSIH
jgi:hypothetical protein